ncbi:MAG: CHAD domain-containing protein [Lentisphaerae bacterium]|nr:CHAD domain-containing protein [Lentisphaerota bacterium]
MRRLSEYELSRKYANEEGHADHVRLIALRLFDGLRTAVEWSAAERRLLEAAGRLHDIGFERDTEDHALLSAERVVREGLAGFSAAGRDTIAGIIRLHAGPWRDALGDPLPVPAANRDRVLRLAAVLRVADGLDHGHIQDARIVSVKRTPAGLTVRVRSDGYGGNVEWAEGKADLWQAVMPLPLRLVAVPAPQGKPLFYGVVRREDGLMDAVRRILYLQYRLMRDNRDRFLEDRGPEDLHDFRVAVNRFRAALRLFRGALRKTCAPELDRRLRDFRRCLGAARDQDVWVRYLESVRAGVRGDAAGLARLASRERARYAALREAVGAVLRSEEYGSLMADTGAFLRVEIPALGGDAVYDGGFRTFAGAKLARRYRKIWRRYGKARNLSVKEAHALRGQLRRLRYWAEFAAPVFGRTGEGLVAGLKSMTGALGKAHDVDVWLEGAQAASVPRPTGLDDALRRRRRSAMRTFRRAWDDLGDPSRQKRVKRVLTAG